MSLLEKFKGIKEKFVNTEKKELLGTIVRIVLWTIFVYATIFPGGSSKSLVIISFGLLMVTWLMEDKKVFVDFFIKPNLLMYSVYFWVLINFLLIYTGHAPQLKFFLNNNIRIAFTSIIFIYLAKKQKTLDLKILVSVSIVMIIIINIWTIIANYKQYNISRLLSTGIIRVKIGIGSYFYIYGLIFFITTQIYIMLKDKDKKAKGISIFLTILSLFTIYKAEFMISLILIVIAIFLIVFKINTFKKLSIFILMGISLIFIASPIIGNGFKMMAESSENYNLKIRFNDIAEVFLNKSIENTVDLKKRLDVYGKSINTFYQNPVVGAGFKDNSQIGEHSMILDELAKYGIIGNIPLGILLYAICSSIMKCFNKTQKELYFICLSIFFVFATINTAMFVAVFYFLFLLAPSIIYLRVEKENT